MGLQFPKRKMYKISLARNLRTQVVKLDWIVDSSLLNRLRESREWKLIGVEENNGFRQDTLESIATE